MVDVAAHAERVSRPQQERDRVPAAILQPPYFDPKADDALNYGAIGMVIGHEITHGFDDTGRKYDARGNLADWWTAEDAKRYEERARRMVKQYSGFEGVEGLKVNGELTLGENISDPRWPQDRLPRAAESLARQAAGPIDGLTPEQRFFLAFAQAWRSSDAPERSGLRSSPAALAAALPRARPARAHAGVRAAFSCDPAKTLLRRRPARTSGDGAMNPSRSSTCAARSRS
jgi:predicted metalloendopeptidase